MVEQILSRDKKAMKHMPKIMQDELKKSGTRSFSTSARSRMPEVDASGSQDQNAIPDLPGIPDASADSPGRQPETFDSIIQKLQDLPEPVDVEKNPGLKFNEPVLPENVKTLNYRNRYDTLQDQFTKMMMRSGKLTRAQNVWLQFPLEVFGSLTLFRI